MAHYEAGRRRLRTAAIAVAMTLMVVPPGAWRAAAAPAIDVTGNWLMEEELPDFGFTVTYVWPLVQTGTSVVANPGPSGTIDPTTGEMHLENAAPNCPGSVNSTTVIVAPDGLTMSGTSVNYSAGTLFCVSFPGIVTGVRCGEPGLPACGPCGDGVLDSGEACDDANAVDGDGCTGCTVDSCFACEGEPSVCTDVCGVCGDGEVGPQEACDDGNAVDGDGCTACTVDPCVACEGEPSVCAATCGPCEACDGTSCRGALGTCATPGRSVVRLRNRADGVRDALTWRWLRGDIDAAELGDPTVGAGYQLCVVDDARNVLVAVTLGPGGTCRGRPCWKALGNPAGSKGYAYADPDRRVGGVRKLLLRTGNDGRAKLVLSAAGAGLGLGPDGVPLVSPVEVRLEGPAGCWHERFGGTLQRNDGETFKAKTP